MEETYQPQAWHDLFLMLGTAAAALTGLIIVALSLHLQNLMRSPASRRRAFNNIFGPGVLIIINALALMPQPTPALGAELIVINTAWLCSPLSILLRFWRRLDIDARARVVVGGITQNLLVIASGLCLLLGTNQAVFVAGMYVLALSQMGAILVVILNAWSMMMGLFTDAPTAQPASSGADIAPR